MVSSSAPPPFRAKQKSAVKPPHAKPAGTPMAGNQAPMMRSPSFMGGKTPHMMPPPAKSSLMQAPAAPQQRRMFADGGFGAPSPLGDGPMGGAPDDSAAAPPPPDQGGGSGMMPMIKPESVNYHDDEQECHMCLHYQDGQCEVLQMQVSPQGACNAFDSNGAGDQDEMSGEPGEDAGDTGMGTSASYSQR